jgi:predicted tellurium resistance membrane protein TerC
VGTTGSWIAKSVLISAGIALVIWVGFYLFFRIHQEIDIAPAYAWRLAVIVFILSAITAMIYFRMRAGR